MYKLRCPWCGETREFNSIKRAVEWASQHVREKHFTMRCPICGAKFNTVSALKRHLTVNHMCSCNKAKCWMLIALYDSVGRSQIACSCVPCLFDEEDRPAFIDESELCRK